MTEDLDRFLRESLGREAQTFEPGRAESAIESVLLERVRSLRRSRARATFATVIVLVAALMTIQEFSATGQRVLTSSPPALAGSPSSSTVRATAGNSGCGESCSVATEPVAASGTPTTVVTTRGGVPATGTVPGLGTGSVSTTSSIPPPLTAISTPSVPTTSAPTDTTVPTGTPTTTGSSSTTTVPPPTDPRTIVFTNADSGRSVQVDQGDSVQLRLAGCPGSGWNSPRTTASAVLRPEPAPPSTSAGETTAAYLAVSSGQAELEAQPRKGSCASASRAFTLMVTVGP